MGAFYPQSIIGVTWLGKFEDKIELSTIRAISLKNTVKTMAFHKCELWEEWGYLWVLVARLFLARNSQRVKAIY